MGKRKASEMSSDDAPGSSWPHPPWRGAGHNDDDSSLSDYGAGGFLDFDSRSDSTYLSDDELSSYPGSDHVGGEDSDGESGIADMLAFLMIDAEELAAAVVPDHSIPVAAPAPEMVVPAAEPVLCLGCGREPTSLRLLPVEHACLCLTCRYNPSGNYAASFATPPAVDPVKKIQGRNAPLAVHMQSEELVSSMF